MKLSIGISIKEDGTIGISENTFPDKKINNRSLKGKSCIDILNDYTVVDIETTGFDPCFDEIIEVSAIKIRNNEKHSTFQSLIHPECKVSKFIVQLTGITNEMLETAPTIESILPNFCNFIGNDIVVGHNVNFDVNFVYDYHLQISNQPFSNDFVDTLRLARKLFPDAPNHKLATLAKHFKLSSVPSHRSMPDCESTLELYRLIENHIRENKINLTGLFKYPYSYHPAAKVSTDKIAFNEDHIFFDKNCTFTGALEKMHRQDAMQIIVDLGGHCNDSVTKKTNYLILGNFDYYRSVKDGQSSKLKKAQSLILGGYDLEIISENIFYSLINIQ
jgi:DNA polymerase-3 subunit epsilon